jgi:hypothetical protein
LRISTSSPSSSSLAAVAPLSPPINLAPDAAGFQKRGRNSLVHVAAENSPQQALPSNFEDRAKAGSGRRRNCSLADDDGGIFWLGRARPTPSLLIARPDVLQISPRFGTSQPSSRELHRSRPRPRAAFSQRSCPLTRDCARSPRSLLRDCACSPSSPSPQTHLLITHSSSSPPALGPPPARR